MGCFIACFGSSKHKKSKKLTTISSTYPHQNLFNRYESTQRTKISEAGEIQDSIKPISELKNLSLKHSKCELIVLGKLTEADKIIQDSIQPFLESREEKEQELNNPIKFNGTFDLKAEEARENVETEKVVKCVVESEEKGSNENEEKEIKKGAKESLSDSCDSSMISYPPMHRYHGCDDDENHDIALCDIDSNGANNLLIQEESSESLFSLSIESRKHVNQVEVDDKEVNSPLKVRDSSEGEMMKSVDSVKQIYSVELDDKEVKRSPGREMKSVDSVKQICSVELDDKEVKRSPERAEREMKANGLSPISRDRTQCTRSVLSPIEKFSQWKMVKARTASTQTALSYDEKENVSLDQELNIPISEELPSFKKMDHGLKRSANDIAVDTSLSSWLVESEKTPNSNDSPSSIGNSSSIERANSWRSFEDRPILGALSVEEVKQISARSSPRRSPTRNPDEMTIIGTVGSYWSLTGQASMDSSNSGSSWKGRSGISRKCSEVVGI